MSYFQAGERPSLVVCFRISLRIPLDNELVYRTAYQSLHKASNQARHYNSIANNDLTHDWLEYYRREDMRSSQIYVNEWNQMDELLSHRSDSPHVYQLYVILSRSIQSRNAMI